MPARRAMTAGTLPASITATRPRSSNTRLMPRLTASSACNSPQQLVETAVTSHYRQGGIDVDTATMRSSVPGLYIAGGVGGHSNGLIGLATYDGKVVADGIEADFAGLKGEPLSESEIGSRTAAARSLAKFVRRARQPGPDQREAARHHVGQSRSGEGCRRHAVGA